jgi:tetratricopeptide (TPR) repeat protein
LVIQAVNFVLEKLRIRPRSSCLALFCCLLFSLTVDAQVNRHLEGLERAAAFINANKLAEAEQQLNQILKVAPNEADALNLLGTIRARQENLTAAEALFSRAIRSNPNLAGAHLNLAHIYLMKAQPDRTAAELKEVLRIEPLNEEATYRLAWLMVSQGQFDECITFIETTKRAQPLTAPLLSLLGDAYLRKGDLGKAEGAYLETLQLSNNNVGALLGLAQISYAKGELQPAADYLSRARAAIGRSPDLLYRFALVAMKLNLKAEALSALKTTVELKPSEPSYRFALGTAWLMHPANLDEGEESFREFLKFRPHDSQGQLHLGYVLLKQKKLAESRDWIQKTIQSGAVTPEAFYYLGLIAQAQDDDARAVELFLKSIQQAPSFSSAHVALGATYLKLKDFDRAQRALETGVKLSPDDSKAHYNLALLYSRLNKKEQAQDEMRIVQRLRAERLKREGKAPENNEDEITPPSSTPPRVP